MDMLDKRLNDKGKNWRHVLKALKVLDYCLHEGSELVVTWAHKNIYIIKTLREFQYIDDDGRDVGQNGEEVFKRFKWLWLTGVSSPCFCEGTNVFNLGWGEIAGWTQWSKDLEVSSYWHWRVCAATRLPSTTKPPAACAARWRRGCRIQVGYRGK